MFTRKVASVALAVSTVLLAFAFGFQLPDRVQALPPALTRVSQAGSAAETMQAEAPLIPAVVYTTSNGHIHELALKVGSWQDRDLTAETVAPLVLPDGQLMAYQRSDGVPMIIYRGGLTQRIYALYMELSLQGGRVQEVWQWADLTTITGAPYAASDPYGYVRSDGISTVVFTGYDGHIHELRLEGAWIWADLTAISDAPKAYLNGRPAAYVRGDGINAVVFADDARQHILEIRLDGTWNWADLTDLSGAPAGIQLPLSAYVRSDGISTIVFMGPSPDIYELRLDDGWKWADLSTASGSPGNAAYPHGYVRSDGINAIVHSAAFALGTDWITELWLDNGWHYFELTSIPNARSGGHPIGYVRADGISAVVYLGDDKSIQEFRLEGSWQRADLTYLAGAPDASGLPWPYNRVAAISRVYLPSVVRR